MQGFGAVLAAAKEMMSIPLVLEGFTFSYWQVFLWVIFAGIVIWFIGRILND